MAELSRGKDTIAGHWELMGIILDEAFALYPQGFPPDLIDEFKTRCRVSGVLGNSAASGTEIIAARGAEHVRTGYPIVYTSADSVLQIAAHEEVIPLEALYEMCLRARRICDERRIGRVIARPFIGAAGNFSRTTNRRDYPMVPPRKTVLDLLLDAGMETAAIGKIENIFAGRGIGRSRPSHSNAEGLAFIEEELATLRHGLAFANLVDFDMLYGHRNDAVGYGAALEEFDAGLAGLLARLAPGDLLVITADHGCDPTFPGTDHTREYAPLLACGPGLAAAPLGTRAAFADVGATIMDIFGIAHDLPGTSFASAVLGAGT
jgi:phosphopentomutase